MFIPPPTPLSAPSSALSGQLPAGVLLGPVEFRGVFGLGSLELVLLNKSNLGSGDGI